jgi:hypothetical protein
MAAPQSPNRMRARLPGAPTGGGEGKPSAGGAGAQLTAVPGSYMGAVRVSERPRNLQEMHERVRLEDRSPWPRGASVPMGKSGKVAHWDGTVWRGGASPGYEPAPPVSPPPPAPPASPPPPAAPTQELPVTPPPPRREPQFPGDEGDRPGDLTR